MTTTAEHALHIADNVHKLANREDAGKCLSEVRRMVERIEAAINRPKPRKYCGNCPTPLEDEQRRKLVQSGEPDRLACSTSLYADKPDDVEVTCWRCAITYNVERLIESGLETAKEWLFEEREVLDIMAQIGRHIPRGTWWSWIQRGVIENKNEWGAEPRYLLGDVQDAWTERVGKRQAAG